MKLKIVAALGLFAFAIAIAYLFWVCLLGFFMSLIPETAQYAWMGKIVVTVIVGWFGGIALPLVPCFMAFAVLFKD